LRARKQIEQSVTPPPQQSCSSVPPLPSNWPPIEEFRDSLDVAFRDISDCGTKPNLEMEQPIPPPPTFYSTTSSRSFNDIDNKTLPLEGLDPLYPLNLPGGLQDNLGCNTDINIGIDSNNDPLLMTPPLSSASSGMCTPSCYPLVSLSGETPESDISASGPDFTNSCTRIIEVLSHYLQICTHDPNRNLSIDSILHVSKYTINSLTVLTEDSSYTPGCGASPFLVVTALQLIVSLFENALTLPIKNATMPTFLMGNYEIDWDISCQLRMQLITRELWRCLGFLNALAVQLQGFVVNISDAPAAAMTSDSPAMGVDASFCEAKCGEVIARFEALIRLIEERAR
jgi:hypothetical protein